MSTSTTTTWLDVKTKPKVKIAKDYARGIVQRDTLYKQKPIVYKSRGNVQQPEPGVVINPDTPKINVTRPKPRIYTGKDR